MAGTVRRRYLDLPWGQVHYRTVDGLAGAAGDGDAPLLVMLHQTPLDSSHYERVLPLLAGFSRPVAIDSPGYGLSDRPPLLPDGIEWGVAEYGRLIWEIVESLGGERIYLFGRATGSVLAVEAAAQQPGRVRALVLHGLPVYDRATKESRLADREFGGPIPPEVGGAHLERLWRRVLGQYPYLSPEEVEWHVERYLHAGPDFALGYRAIWRYDLAAAAARVESPMLLLGGTRDRVHPWFADARRLLPLAESESFDGATDFVAADEPDRFAASLRRFLTAH
ncbi:MAG: alpha/beta hydrolase [Chloroflexi bacterium]|nr:alpha/beta hydrolase [Chloroflexota bacterium]